MAPMKLALLTASLLLISLLNALAAEQQKIDRILVVKSEHRLQLLKGGTVVRTYTVAIGRGGVAPKQQQGDHKTPERIYRIDRRKANSRFHRALRISYPNDADRERARQLGVDPGGDIMIHGIMNGFRWIGSMHRMFDWTDGCIAVTDEEIDEIWALVPDGTAVEIRH